jgi:sulfate transport system substrate-binding protein
MFARRLLSEPATLLSFRGHRRAVTGVRASSVVVAALTALTLSACGKRPDASPSAESALLIAAYDPARTFVAEANKRFADAEKAAGHPVTLRESFGGSGKQARAVIDGLAADVVVLGLADDVNALADAKLVRADWAAARGGQLAPYTSTVVFLVRAGNPKGIRDWSDLARQDVALVAPNPKSSSAAKLAYLAAWGWAVRQPNGSDTTAEALVRALYTKAVVLDATARAAATTFVQNGIGDVLVTWENEAYLAKDENKGAPIEVVAPSLSIVAEPAIAVVDANVDKHGTRAVAERYQALLASPEMQDAAAKAHFRPRNAETFAAHRQEFAPVQLFTVDEVFGSWATAKAKHFATGALLDRILDSRK